MTLCRGDTIVGVQNPCVELYAGGDYRIYEYYQGPEITGGNIAQGNADYVYMNNGFYLWLENKSEYGGNIGIYYAETNAYVNYCGVNLSHCDCSGSYFDCILGCSSSDPKIEMCCDIPVIEILL